jgi:NADP-dependent 3-hydroxy acid dehydrogenase YdfG
MDEKVVIITGASGGIGAATARLLAERGCRLVLAAHRSSEALAALVADLERGGGRAIFARADVRRPEDMQGLVTLARERFGRLDVLVSNAGVGPIAALDEARVGDWDLMIDVNLRGVLHGIAAALPLFRQQGSGHFVNVASTAGYTIVPNMAVYAATKVAVRVVSEGLRQEAGDKLRVTVVSPGFVRTAFADGAANAGVRAALQARRDQIAIAPEAIARAIAFAIQQPADVDVNEIVVRPTAQS